MRTLGIDLSANAGDTSACSVDWRTGGVTFHERGATDSELAALALSMHRVGIDAPFGWPDAFIDAIEDHRDGSPWPGRGLDPGRHRKTLRYRATDLRVGERGRLPLSPSSDRIAVTAMRCAAIQDLISREESVDRAGLEGRLVEVYPAAALRAWALPDVSYKGKEHRENRVALSRRLLAKCPGLANTAEIAERCADDDDDFDALICALVARAAMLGQTETPADADLAQARREGWIHVPTGGLTEIFEAGVP